MKLLQKSNPTILKITIILFMLLTVYLGTDMAHIAHYPAPEGEEIIIHPYYATSSHVFTMQNIYIDVDGKIRRL